MLRLIELLNGLWGWPLAPRLAMSVFVALGVLPTALLAWYHGERGRQRVTVLEILTLTTLATGFVAVLAALGFVSIAS